MKPLNQCGGGEKEGVYGSPAGIVVHGQGVSFYRTSAGTVSEPINPEP
jgi:hypothetical protein